MGKRRTKLGGRRKLAQLSKVRAEMAHVSALLQTTASSEERGLIRRRLIDLMAQEERLSAQIAAMLWD